MGSEAVRIWLEDTNWHEAERLAWTQKIGHNTQTRNTSAMVMSLVIRRRRSMEKI
jgi:hypothetical protein